MILKLHHKVQRIKTNITEIGITLICGGMGQEKPILVSCKAILRKIN